MLALVACFASLAGFLFGYDLGLIGGALLNIRDAFGISDWAAEAIVAAAKFGAVPGTFLGGALMLHYGRRRAIGVDSLFFMAGPLIMAFAMGVWGLVAGRVVIGLGIGISAAVVPAYLGEVAPARVRGRVVECYELLLCAGVLAAALGDAAFQSLPGNWRWMVGAPLVPALLLSLSLCLLPESPRWLVIRGRLDEALAVIHRVYMGHILPAGMQQSTAEVEHELMQLWSSVEKERDAAAAQRQAHLERQRRRQELRHTKLAPLSSSPVGLGGSSTGGGSAGSEAGKGGWQQLQPADEEADGERQQAAAAEAVAVEAGAAGVRQRMELAVRALDTPEPGDAAAEQHSLLAAGMPSSSSQPAVPQSPLRVPPHLRRIRTSSAQDLRQLAEVELQTPLAGAAAAGAVAGAPTASAAAAAAAAARVSDSIGGGSGLSATGQGLEPRAGSLGSGEWGAATLSGSQQLERLASRLSDRPPQPPLAEEEGLQQQEDGEGSGAPGEPGAGASLAGQPAGSSQLAPPSFWRTLRDMTTDIRLVAAGPEGQALRMALWLAFFNQAFASTSIVNYAPQVLERAGVDSHSAAMLLSAAVGGSKLAGVALSFLLVDSLGRRPLLVWGSAGCAAALAALALADWLAVRAFLVVGLCAFIFAFSVSWAGVFWVLLSELFSMSAKSPAASAATAVLFLTGAIADTLFLSLHAWLGPFAFLLFAALAATAGLWVYAVVPETAGKTLQEVQALLALRVTAGSRGGRWPAQERQGLLPPGAALSDGGLER